ncbi:hypothetical protein [Ralstonia pseudosolanacearum]
MLFEDFHREIQLARPILTPYEREDGYAYKVGSKRVIRLSPLKSGEFYLVRAASKRVKIPNSSGRFSGSLAELLTIIDHEIAVTQAETPRKRTRVTKTRVSHPRPSASLPPIPRNVIKEFDFKVVMSGLERQQNIIYRWEIFDGLKRVGVYIGLTGQEDHDERIRRYGRRVMGIQRGLPYSPEAPGGYRKVHWALEAALHSERRIVLTLLSGLQPGMTLLQLESQYIREHDSFGPAPHQLNERP